MIFKTQLRRKKAATELASDLRQLGPKIAEQLEPRMAPVLEEGEAMPDVAHLLDVLARMLVRESEALEAVDDERSREGSEVSDARRELRQRAEPELRSRVVWVRDQMRNAYGAARANRILQHEGRTPRALEDLKIMAEDMVSRLPDVEPPKRKPGSAPKPAEWAEHVRPALDDFSGLLEKLGSHSENRAIAADQRKEALALFDLNYTRFLRLTELFLQLAGLESVAERLPGHPGHPAESVPGKAGERDKAPQAGERNRVA